MGRIWFDSSLSKRQAPKVNETTLAGITGGQECSQLAEVDLAHFAAMLGMTRDQYIALMHKCFQENRLMDLLRFESRCALEGWIMETGRFEDGKDFGVMFRLALNRSHDPALYCVCNVKESVVYVQQTIPGLAIIGACGHMVPDAMKTMDIFEIMFGDLETNILEINHGEN